MSISALAFVSVAARGDSVAGSGTRSSPGGAREICQDRIVACDGYLKHGAPSGSAASRRRAVKLAVGTAHKGAGGLRARWIRESAQAGEGRAGCDFECGAKVVHPAEFRRAVERAVGIKKKSARRIRARPGARCAGELSP